VHFPIYRDKNGELITERDEFFQLANKDQPNRGLVMMFDKSKDLALVRVEFVPKGVEYMAIARADVTPGNMVHAVGNSPVAGSLWTYSSGTVRQYVRRTYMVGGPEGIPFEIDAKIIEATMHSNPADSGGPLVNHRGDLVGVTQSYSSEGRNVTTYIDAREANALIERNFERRGE